MVAIVAAFAMTMVAAQQQPPTDEEPATAGELTASDRTVEVESPTSDEQIRSRITGILDSTDRFLNPAVEVRDGIVFLSGGALGDGDREWAGELALNTEGVVAIVNDMELAAAPVWTLEPARAELRELWRQLVQATPLVLIGIVVLLATFGAARLLVRAAASQLERRVKVDLVRNIVEKLLYVGIVLIGVYVFLRISGLTRVAVTLAGGTGIIGLIVGFAFRDIAENFLASVLISIQRPFRIGDTVEVDGHTGIVQKVTTRGTVLMDFDGNHIQIANSTVYKNTIRNLTANPKMRIGFRIGVGYDSSIIDAQQIALETVREHSAVLDTPEPIVLVEELGAASIAIRVYFWIDCHEYSHVRVRSSIMRLVYGAYDDAGISLPDEAREVIFPQPVPVRMLESGEGAGTPPRTRTQSSADRAEATEAEGSLRSEVAEIRRQAADARVPEEGADIMQADQDGNDDA